MRRILLAAFSVLPCIAFAQPKELRIDQAAPKHAASTRPVYTYVEQMPEFKGDREAYISSNMIYPREALKNNIEGRVVLKFIVNEDGKLSDVAIVRGLTDECNAEAMRLVKNMPPWVPGKQSGKVVRVYYTLVVNFRYPQK